MINLLNDYHNKFLRFHKMSRIKIDYKKKIVQIKTI